VTAHAVADDEEQSVIIPDGHGAIDILVNFAAHTNVAFSAIEQHTFYPFKVRMREIAE
jgi:hypothetical protein